MFIEAAPHDGSVRLGHHGLEVPNREVRDGSGQIPEIAIDDENLLDIPGMADDALHQIAQVDARDQDTCPGSIQHLGGLGGGQAGVQRVADRAHADNAVPRLQMALRVPGQCGHPVALLDPQIGKHARDAFRPAPQRIIADPVHHARPARRDHFGIGMPFGGMVQKFVESQPIGLQRAVDHRDAPI